MAHHRISRIALALFAAAALGTAAHAADEPPAAEPARELTRQQVAEDLVAWLTWTDATHPDLAYSADRETLETRAAAIAAELPDTMDRLDAWKRLAALNPVLNDAHLGLVIPEPVVQAADLPTIEVAREADGLRVTSQDGPLPQGALITHIGSDSIPETLAEFGELARGESGALRERIVSLRLGRILALVLEDQGAPQLQYRLTDGSTHSFAQPISLVPAAVENRAYVLRWAGDTAILDVPSFVREREEEFAGFLETSFAAIAERGAAALVIDLRGNGGGARQLSDRLMAYLTDQPYSPIAGVSARITPQNQAMIPGSSPGDVVTVPFAQTVNPPAELDNRFAGPVTLAIGPNTYSQAIVFAATALDHQVATLCGQPTEAPANQTGQVQHFTLPHSGFAVRAPLYVLYRASGDRSRAPLVPEADCPDL